MAVVIRVIFQFVTTLLKLLSIAALGLVIAAGVYCYGLSVGLNMAAEDADGYDQQQIELVANIVFGFGVGTSAASNYALPVRARSSAEAPTSEAHDAQPHTGLMAIGAIGIIGSIIAIVRIWILTRCVLIAVRAGKMSVTIPAGMPTPPGPFASLVEAHARIRSWWASSSARFSWSACSW